MRSRSRRFCWLLCVGGLRALATEAPDGVLPSAVARQDVDAVAAFQDALSPYGDWVTVKGVGTVWRPFEAMVGTDFVPYVTLGRWGYSEAGWTFESDWAWGWAPFHYGRWFVSRDHGWVWAPGLKWAPAWVEWRWGGGFIGWAPLAPAGLTEEPRWVFVEAAHFTLPTVGFYLLPPELADVAYQQTVPGPRGRAYGVDWGSGPTPSEVEQATGRPVPRVEPQPEGVKGLVPPPRP